MNRRIVLVLGAIALVGGALFATRWWTAKAPRVSGFIEAYEIRLGSRVGGRVVKVHGDEGDRVTAGDVLVELDPFDLLARQAEVRAQLAASEAEYERLQHGFRPEEIVQAQQRYEELAARHKELVDGPRKQEIEVARQRLAAAQAQATLAKQQHDRREQLFKTKAIPRDEMDQAIAELSVAQRTAAARQEELNLLLEGTRPETIAAARAQMEAAKAAWELHKSGYRKEDIAQAKAQVDAARAALDVIDSQLKELSIRAPIDGVIETMDLRPGDLVGAGVPVMSMFDTSELWVRSYLPADLHLKIGQQLPVTVDGFPGRHFRGEVTYIAREAEFTPMNVQTPEERAKQVFRFKVTLREGFEELRPGMLADVWLPEPQKRTDEPGASHE